MGDPFHRFPPRNTTPLLPVEFSFTNPGTSQSKQARDWPPPPLDPYNLSTLGAPARRHSLHPGKANVVADQSLFKATKPGPLTSAELSSSTHAFKLRANKSQSSSNPVNNALLRQEVFKPAHTLTPTPLPSIKSSAGVFLSTPSPAAALRPSNKPSSKPQSRASTGSVNTSPFLEFEPSPLLKKSNTRDTGSEGDVGMGYSDRNTTAAPPERRPSAITGSVDYQRASNVCPVEPTSTVLPLGRLQGEVREPMLPPKTPSRRSLDRNAPACDCNASKTELREMKIKYRELETQHDGISEKAASLSSLLRELCQERTETEGELHTVKTLLAEALENADELQAQIGGLRQHNANFKQLSADLEALRHDAREANMGESFELQLSTLVTQVTPVSILAVEKSQAVVEEKRQQLRDTIAEYQSGCAELEGSLRRQQGVSDLLRDELSQVRGNYSESLDLNAELRTSLAAMANEHAETSKSLATLHKQIDDLTNERSDLRASESSALEEVKSLKLSVSSLTSNNERITGLLGENEAAFAKKLELLGEQNDTGSRNLKKALTELAQTTGSLESLRSVHDEILAQMEVHRREENEARERVSLLVHDAELRSQSLEEARKLNGSSAVRLSELDRKLSLAGEENGNLKGRLAELEKACSVQVTELKVAQSELAQSHGELLILREKLAKAATAHEKVDALERVLSENKSKVECQNVELSHIGQQLVQAKESHNAWYVGFFAVVYTPKRATYSTVERDALLGKTHASGERVAQLQRELQALRDQVDQNRESTQRSNSQLVREQGLRQAAEQQLKDSTRALEEFGAEQQGKIQSLTAELSAQQAEVKRLGNDLSASASAKVATQINRQATIEGVLSNFRESSQQEIAALTTHVSDQKVKTSLLEQQIAGANARCLEHKAEANTHRSEAENARASVALIEYRLKEKEIELSSLRLKVQGLEAASATSATIVDPTWQARVSEQESIIENLNSEILSMKRDVEMISERYNTGKLADPEKDFITEVTTALTREKNKAMNALRGEIKRKDSEITAHKAKITELRASLFAQIQKSDTLSDELKEIRGDPYSANPNGLQGTMQEMHHPPSSSLSEAPAPDHDEPAPDTPTVSSKRAAPPTNPQQPPVATKQKPQQYRTFTEIERINSNGGDEIQEFEEPEPARPSGSTGRKRLAADIEPADDAETEQTENRRKGTTKAKKTGKAADTGVTAKDAPQANTRGKAGKRRKA
ncbi:hypothetical protein FRC10_001070 [Ceratobasidium sp. 414]|nr:hypothetical protein FRC10_001070 [Ceratobasidium sp. 414]